MILRCVLVLPEGVELAGHTAVVRVEDVTVADAPAVEVVSSVLPAGARSVDLSVPAPPAGRRWIVTAVLQRGHRLAAGDLLTTVSVPVPEATTDASRALPVEVPVTLI
jgi:hypothetical protein